MVQLAGAGCFVDAPMSGSVVGAANATLTLMLGAPSGDSLLLKRIKEVLVHNGQTGCTSRQKWGWTSGQNDQQLFTGC